MKETLGQYRVVLALPDARRVLLADSISRSGDWLLFMAMSVLIERTGGAAGLAAFSVLRIGLPVLIGPWAGRWGSRLPPRSVMIGSDLARAGTLALAVGAALTDQSLPVLLALVVVNSAFSSWYSPAERRFQRDLMAEESRAALNAVLGTTGSVVLVIAPALGGVVAAAAGAAGALALDALSFLASALLLSRVRATAAPAASASAADSTEDAAPRTGSGSGAWRSGLETALRDRTVGACLLAQVAACVAAGAGFVLMPATAAQVSSSAGALGWLTAALGVGSVLGMLIGGPLARQGRVRSGILSVAGFGVLLGVLGSARTFWAAVLLCALIGVTDAVAEPLYWTTYGNRVPEARSGPFYGLVESGFTGGLALGGLLAGSAVAWWGRTAGAGAMAVLVGCVALVALASVPAAAAASRPAAENGTR